MSTKDSTPKPGYFSTGHETNAFRIVLSPHANPDQAKLEEKRENLRKLIRIKKDVQNNQMGAREMIEILMHWDDANIFDYQLGPDGIEVTEEGFDTKKLRDRVLAVAGRAIADLKSKLLFKAVAFYPSLASAPFLL